jgi:flavin-binding protein dodecin
VFGLGHRLEESSGLAAHRAREGSVAASAPDHRLGLKAKAVAVKPVTDVVETMLASVEAVGSSETWRSPAAEERGERGSQTKEAVDLARPADRQGLENEAKAGVRGKRPRGRAFRPSTY